MLQHKRTLAGILAATMMFSLTACGGGGATKDPGSDAAQDPNEAVAAGTLQLSEWEESSGIFNTDETDEELYEKAKEEGKVTIYSISSRITKVANAFRTVRCTTSIFWRASSITTSRQISCRTLMKSTPRRRPRCMSS